jgi:hypothetical protein
LATIVASPPASVTIVYELKCKPSQRMFGPGEMAQNPPPPWPPAGWTIPNLKPVRPKDESRPPVLPPPGVRVLPPPEYDIGSIPYTGKLSIVTVETLEELSAHARARHRRQRRSPALTPARVAARSSWSLTTSCASTAGRRRYSCGMRWALSRVAKGSPKRAHPGRSKKVSRSQIGERSP